MRFKTGFIFLMLLAASGIHSLPSQNQWKENPEVAWSMDIALAPACATRPLHKDTDGYGSIQRAVDPALLFPGENSKGGHIRPYRWYFPPERGLVMRL